MAGLFDNIHPELSQDNAIEILSRKPEELTCASDYYMAISHLINYPGQRSELALINFLSSSACDDSILLAKRKAVEILGRMKAVAAESEIGKCLNSTDVYMVENAAWSLSQLSCKNVQLHQLMLELLSDPKQNQRVLIQSLSQLKVQAALPMITQLQSSERPGVRGAAIAALVQLSGQSEKIDLLADHLSLPNQMDRQSAIQDIIDCNASQFLRQVIASPVSPVFKMRAVKLLLDPLNINGVHLNILPMIEQILRDDPREINILHHFDVSLDANDLVLGLFHPDFSRCYLSMQSLLTCDPIDLWSSLEQNWQLKAYNDYGAHYFFMRLFGLIDGWEGSAILSVQEILKHAIEDQRPQFKKSGPAAILSLTRLYPDAIGHYLESLLSHTKTLFWEKRYAALMAIDCYLSEDQRMIYHKQIQDVAKMDPDAVIRLKANSVAASIVR
tara:strand:- start:4672 stop:6003 length:1332 start_codon:yes stop_codon:yes gene_type:complete